MSHKAFAFVSFLTIAVFFTSTAISELFLSLEQVAMVKGLIACPGLFVLVPSLAITAISGNIIAKASRYKKLVKTKKKRMPIIAANGIIILLPSAVYLNILASSGNFNTVFYIVQVLELLAGASNLTLMFLNIKDSVKQVSKKPLKHRT